MSQLLRAGQITISTDRKALETRPATPVDVTQADRGPDRQRPPRDGGEECEQLRRRIAGLEEAAANEAHERKALEEAAYRRGMDEGMKLGVSTVKRDHEEQLATLRTGVLEALDAFSAQLRAIEPLALETTLAALEKVLGDPASYAELVGQTARHHLAQLPDSSAVSVRVSATDFPDAEQLHLAFGPLAGHPALSVQADPQLSAGACLIDLKLGRLDVSLPQQRAHLMAALDTLRGAA
jgi:flagellar assembly protein FliH